MKHMFTFYRYYMKCFKKRDLRFDHGQPLDINNYHIWHNCVTFFYEQKEPAHLLIIIDGEWLSDH